MQRACGCVKVAFLESVGAYCILCERRAVYSFYNSLYTDSAGHHKQSNHDNEVTLNYFETISIPAWLNIRTHMYTRMHTYLMALFSRQWGTNGIGHLRIELLRLERWNLRSFWSRVMDLCVSETTQMKAFVTNNTSAVRSSSVHRDKAYRPYPVRVPLSNHSCAIWQTQWINEPS